MGEFLLSSPFLGLSSAPHIIFAPFPLMRLFFFPSFSSVPVKAGGRSPIFLPSSSLLSCRHLVARDDACHFFSLPLVLPSFHSERKSETKSCQAQTAQGSRIKSPSRYYGTPYKKAPCSLDRAGWLAAKRIFTPFPRSFLSPRLTALLILTRAFRSKLLLSPFFGGEVGKERAKYLCSIPRVHLRKSKVFSSFFVSQGPPANEGGRSRDFPPSRPSL